MVIGKGSVADRFIEYNQKENFIIFAGDHTSSNVEFFEPELAHLKNLIAESKNKALIYFSTCSVNDPDEISSAYVQNKLKIEAFISENFSQFLIIRVPNVVGRSTEDNGLVNFLFKKIMSGSSISIWKNAFRNLLDVDDLFFVTDFILRENKINNQIIQIANPTHLPVSDIVLKIENFVNKKALVDAIDKGSNYSIDIEIVKPIMYKLGLQFSDSYCENILKKYFSTYLGQPQKLSVVVPTYFAEKGPHEFYKRTSAVLNQLSPHFTSEIIFVNDGSTDKTLSILHELAKKDSMIKIINLSRNFGNQCAIAAGIDRAECDLLVIIDDDLQDPPEVILSMISLWQNGFDIVYGVRRKRFKISLFFKIAAKIYYRLLDYLSDTKIPLDTGDFRLIDKKALIHLKQIREENRYFRGIVAWIGFKQFGFLYDRDPRFAGESNFTLRKYFKFAFDGLTSFSEKPLYFSSLLGLFITSLSLLFGLWIVYSKIVNPEFTIRGWASLVTIMLFFGGIQLLSIGVIGLYIGKIYREVKDRPIYIVESETGFSSKGQGASLG